jgi:hypothetical protein
MRKDKLDGPSQTLIYAIEINKGVALSTWKRFRELTSK